MPEMINRKQLAAKLGCSVRQIDKLRKKGLIPKRTIDPGKPGRIQWKLSDIEKWIMNL